MIWHITKREVYDHFTSLRFALTVGLIALLMTLNGLIFAGSDYRQRLSEYSQNVNWVADKVKASCQHLNGLATQGPVGFYKRPSCLAFCANDQEDALPMQIRGQGGLRTTGIGAGQPESSYEYRDPWKLEYIQDTYQKNHILGPLAALDWSIIIGVVVSFVAILFTFDSISGERERGTLKLMLSNSVPRGAILLGKFLGALISIAVPVLVGTLLSLLIIVLSGIVPLGSDNWAKIGLMMFVSIVYISMFIGIGLAISSRMMNSSTSLIVLLLIWMIIVVLLPNTLGCVVSIVRKVPSQREFQKNKQATMESLKKEYSYLFQYGSPSQPNPDMRAIKLWAEYITVQLETEARLADGHLDAQFAQIRFARQILRSASPTAIYNYAMESLAGTGFARHQQFVDIVRRYREQFIEFIKITDRSDSESFHVYYLKEGLSERPVSFGNVPRFLEPIGFGVAARTALMDLSLLLLFSTIFFFAGYVAFLRYSVR